MRKHLENLSVADLTKIASDISIPYTNQADTAKVVSDYYRAYSLRWVDLVARYKSIIPDLK